MATEILDNSFAEPGDVIFVRHGKADIAGHGIRQFQRRFSLAEADWGHVGMVVSHNEIIEAQFRKNADVFDLAAWKTARKTGETYLILRHPQLSSSKKAPLVKAAAIYWHGEAYAARELLRDESVEPGRSICSSLVLKILERATLISTIRSPESAQILPGELADLLTSNGWVEVSTTDRYFKEFALFLPKTISISIMFEDQNRRMNNAIVELGTLTAGVTGILKVTAQSNYSLTLRNLAAGSGVSTRVFLFGCLDSALSAVNHLVDMERNQPPNWKYEDKTLILKEHCEHNVVAAIDIYYDVLRHCASEFESIEAKMESSCSKLASFGKFPSKRKSSHDCAESEISHNFSDEISCRHAVEELLKLYFEINLVTYIFADSQGKDPSLNKGDVESRRSHIRAVKEGSYKAILNSGLDVQEQFDRKIEVYCVFKEQLREFFNEIEVYEEVIHLDNYINRLMEGTRPSVPITASEIS